MSSIVENKGFMRFENIDSAIKYGEMIAASSFCPKSFIGKPNDVLVAIQMGLELGLAPLQSLQNIAVINGRPSLWGDAMLAVCKTGADFEYVNEWFDEENRIALCEAKRKGEPAQIRGFSEDDARKARLWGKQGPWTDYPKRMMQMRARGFALRDVFPHLLRGLIAAEEAQDYAPPYIKDADVGSQKTLSHSSAGTSVDVSDCVEELRAMVDVGIVTAADCNAVMSKHGFLSMEEVYCRPPLVTKALDYWKKKYADRLMEGKDV